MTTAEILLEELVIAVMHKVGSEIRLVDDQRLARVFDDAARKSPLFRRFRAHPQYGFSERLSRVLQNLDLGGSIIRENAPTKYFRVSGHTSGPYGAGKLSMLDKTEQASVEELASAIRETFGRGHSTQE